jgi:cobalt-zinc-cadmium efflux system membrane fusion protein
VQTDEGKSVVFVRTKTGFQAVLKRWATAAAPVTVRSGLKGTEQIATVNSFTLKAESRQERSGGGLSR